MSRGEAMRRGAIKKRQCGGEWVGSALRVGGRDRQVLAQTTQDVKLVTPARGLLMDILILSMSWMSQHYITYRKFGCQSIRISLFKRDSCFTFYTLVCIIYLISISKKKFAFTRCVRCLQAI